MKTAVYHFTNSDGIKYQKLIDEFNEFAQANNLTISEFFIDKNGLVYQQSEFDRFLSTCEQFDTLIVKDFYHLCKNTMKCLSIIRELHDKGIKIYAIKDGIIDFNNVDFSKTLKVATYSRHWRASKIQKTFVPLKNDILNLFVNKETNWSIVDQYCDESKNEKDETQLQLASLLENKDKYDLLVVNTLHEINFKTARFIKILYELNLDVYSLQEGLIRIARSD
ncbi:MAG: recombinase family protein [Eubacterium sp.]|nr:recombinase family protein [Eubacterium sp.]